MQGWALITYESLKDLFSSKDDVIRYINNFEDPKRTEQFLEAAKFYHFAKSYYCPNCFPSKRIEICPNCEKPFEMPAYIVLIMIVSIMERLSLGLAEFTDFFDWVNKREIVRHYQNMLESRKIKRYKELIHSLRERWNQEYGSVTKVTEFLNEFLEQEEKIEFIRSIRYLREVPELPPKFPRMGDIEDKTREELTRMHKEWEKILQKESQLSFKTDEDVKNHVRNHNSEMTWAALPICFDEKHYWKCYARDSFGRGLGFCFYVRHCSLTHDERMLNEHFEKTVKTIYDWRSKFVHEARLPPIGEVAMIASVYKKGKKFLPVMIQLTTTKLKPVFERMLKRHFDQYQKKG